MAITNPKTKEKMKKKNPKSIRVGDDGSVSKKSTTKPKKEGSWWEGRRAKRDRAATKKGMAESKMKSTIAKAEKKYAKESMFKKAADARDKAKTTPGKARSFKDAFDAATKEGKSRFMVGGKSYLTTKGKREKRFDPTKTKAAEPKNLGEKKLLVLKLKKSGKMLETKEE